MIAGEPRVCERDGQKQVVDANGDELVCRRDTQHCCGTGRRYHQIDVKRFVATGDVGPACGVTDHHTDVTWDLRLRADLDPVWSGCGYQDCYGDYDPRNPHPKRSGRTGLAARLEAMSVEEFDAAVAAHRAAHTDGERR